MTSHDLTQLMIAQFGDHCSVGVHIHWKWFCQSNTIGELKIIKLIVLELGLWSRVYWRRVIWQPIWRHRQRFYRLWLGPYLRKHLLRGLPIHRKCPQWFCDQWVQRLHKVLPQWMLWKGSNGIGCFHQVGLQEQRVLNNEYKILDDVFQEILCNFSIGDLDGVLLWNQDVVDSNWDHSSLFFSVLNGNLNFGIRVHPRTYPISSYFVEFLD